MCSCTQCLMIFVLLFYWFDRKRILLQIPSSWIKSMSAAVRWSSCVFTVSPWTRSHLTCVTSLTFSLLLLSATLWLCPPPINPAEGKQTDHQELTETDIRNLFTSVMWCNSGHSVEKKSVLEVNRQFYCHINPSIIFVRYHAWLTAVETKDIIQNIGWDWDLF